MTQASSISDNTQRRLQNQQAILINGEWQFTDPSLSSEVFNPSTGDVISYASNAQSEDVEAAVAAARLSLEQQVWAGLAPATRAKTLWKVADLIEAHKKELAELEMLDAGKFLQSAEQGEVAMAAESFRYFAGWCTKLDGSSKTLSAAPQSAFHAYTRREPVGVVALIVPWNGPLVQAAWKLAPALAAGCSVILKPAQETPLSTVRLGELMVQAGIPDGVINILLGDGARIGQQLAAHPNIDKISFTGSTAVGKKIVDAAKTNLKKVSLELGGKSPMIVFADADVEAAANGAIDAIFSNAGQVCVAGSRLYIHDKLYEPLLARIVEKANAIRVGSAMDPSMTMGPLISAAHRANVQRKIDDAIHQGARLLCGGKAVEDTQAYCLQATVFTDIPADAALLKEEVFGPVLAVSRFSEEDDIMALANDSDYGLAASIWTSDISLAHRSAAAIKAGLLWVNCHGLPDMAIPFGGYKQSGWGRENGEEALLQYTEQKSVVIKL